LSLGSDIAHLRRPDGSRHVERFGSIALFRDGIAQTEERLLADDWA
jgi:hypothetical protein